MKFSRSLLSLAIFSLASIAVATVNAQPVPAIGTNTAAKQAAALPVPPVANKPSGSTTAKIADVPAAATSNAVSLSQDSSGARDPFTNKRLPQERLDERLAYEKGVTAILAEKKKQADLTAAPAKPSTAPAVVQERLKKEVAENVRASSGSKGVKTGTKLDAKALTAVQPMAAPSSMTLMPTASLPRPNPPVQLVGVMREGGAGVGVFTMGTEIAYAKAGELAFGRKVSAVSERSATVEGQAMTIASTSIAVNEKSSVNNHTSVVPGRPSAPSIGQSSAPVTRTADGMAVPTAIPVGQAANPAGQLFPTPLR
jgi:hypothetical protein